MNTQKHSTICIKYTLLNFLKCLCFLYRNKHWQLPFGKHEAGIKGSLRKPLPCPLFSLGDEQWLADLVPS